VEGQHLVPKWMQMMLAGIILIVAVWVIFWSGLK